MTVPEDEQTTAADTDQLTIDDKVQTILPSDGGPRDGTGIHTITAHTTPPDTAFLAIKKKSHANMLPLEVADLYVSDLRKRTGLAAEGAEQQAGPQAKPVYQLVMEFKNEDGLARIVPTFVDTGFYNNNYRR
jgi:hypothetical protein